MPILWRVFLAAASTGVQVGAVLAGSRLVVGELGAAGLGAVRYSIGAAALLPIALLAGPWPRFARRDWLPILVLGAMQFAIVVVLLNYAVAQAPAGRVALLFATFPVVTLGFSVLKGMDRLSWRKGVGVVLTMLGVALALGDAWRQSGNWLGDLAALAAAFSGAICTVLYRPYLQRYGALPLGVVAMAASVVALLPVLVFDHGLLDRMAALPPLHWVLVAAIGVSSGAAYGLWLWALRHISPTELAVFVGLGPVTATALGVWLFQDPLTPGFLAGMVALGAGLWLATRTPRPASP